MYNFQYFFYSLRFTQFKIAVTISKVKNSFTIVFSVCNNLEKHVWFVVEKKFFFSPSGFSLFWVLPQKTGFLDFFWAR